jgi:hypothetical protein
MLASGAGAASRHSISTGVFAGMLFATTSGSSSSAVLPGDPATGRASLHTAWWRATAGGRLMRRAAALLAWLGVTIVGCKVVLDTAGAGVRTERIELRRRALSGDSSNRCRRPYARRRTSGLP